VTEYTDEQGEKRIRLSVTQWAVAAFLGLLSTGGISSGIYANQAYRELADAQKVNELGIAENASSVEAIDDRLDKVEEVARNSGAIVTELRGKLERLDERTTRTGQDVKDILILLRDRASP
jgi:hypothetical protein